MFLVPLKTLLTDAMRQTLDSEYIAPDFRNVNVSIDFPVAEEDYPAVWVEFASTSNLEVAGVHHRETEPGSEGFRRFTRWRFQGNATYTVIAFTSLERDRLFDEVVRIMAFGHEVPETSEFRSYIEDNEFLGLNFDFDQISVGPITASPGTPWGTDDMMYEASITMECIGEFISDAATATLLPLSEVILTSYSDREPDPVPDGAWQ